MLCPLCAYDKPMLFSSLPFLHSHMNRLMRACTHAFAAADAFHAVWGLAHIYAHLACTRAGAARGTFLCIHANSQKGDRMKESVYRTQRAEIAAK